jgi:hypothetical protein
VTADEFIVGIDDSPSARGLPLRTPDRPEQRLAPFMGRVAGGHRDMYVYPVIADYVYPDGPGWSAGVRQ